MAEQWYQWNLHKQEPLLIPFIFKLLVPLLQLWPVFHTQQCNVMITNSERRMQDKRFQGLCTKIVSEWYSQTEGNDMLNRCDFKCLFKVENVRGRRRSTGRLFQAYGPAMARALSPMVERRSTSISTHQSSSDTMFQTVKHDSFYKVSSISTFHRIFHILNHHIHTRRLEETTQTS